ncbi:hypothetical protein NIASO_01285 [Niabella soli DSM 19437]|uniref:Uncharacterized protein n=1 Tax=Niabella soli DSM 19437 TaxID=929713 RepID=W0F6I9_9BACT|nr:hypothetical protein NIASO_01285 [Niabella soli DSM 19437]
MIPGAISQLTLHFLGDSLFIEDENNHLEALSVLFILLLKQKCPADRRGAKCFHNGIILIVNCFQGKYSIIRI